MTIIEKFFPRNPIQYVEKEARYSQIGREGNLTPTVLDLGFGYGHHWDQGSQSVSSSISLTALDAVAASSNETDARFADFDRIVGRLPEILEGIPSKSFDIVMAFDLIEHLSKEDGYRLVYQMERICRTSALIFTPNGHVWQPPTSQNPFQAHISGWKPGEFRSLGWAQRRGCRGMKKFYGPLADALIFPDSKFFAILRIPLDLIATRLAKFSFSFIAVFRPSRKFLRYQSLVDLAKTG